VVGAKVLLRSSFGLRLRASGGDRRVGQSAGVDVDVTRVQGFTISGFVAGLTRMLAAAPATNPETVYPYTRATSTSPPALCPTRRSPPLARSLRPKELLSRYLAPTTDANDITATTNQRERGSSSHCALTEMPSSPPKSEPQTKTVRYSVNCAAIVTRVKTGPVWRSVSSPITRPANAPAPAPMNSAAHGG